MGASGIDFTVRIRRFLDFRIFRYAERAEGAAQLLLQIFWQQVGCLESEYISRVQSQIEILRQLQ